MKLQGNLAEGTVPAFKQVVQKLSNEDRWNFWVEYGHLGYINTVEPGSLVTWQILKKMREWNSNFQPLNGLIAVAIGMVKNEHFLTSPVISRVPEAPWLPENDHACS